MAEMPEDVITESKFTRITSKLLDDAIVISVYSRHNTDRHWMIDEGYTISINEFEHVMDTMIDLMIKYRED